MACNCPIVSTDVGLASIFLSPDSIFTPGKILDAKPNVDYAHKKVKDYLMPSGFESFVDVFSKIEK